MTDKLIERLLKEWGRWHHLNEMAIASNKTPSDSEIDIEVEAWNSVRRAYSEAAIALQDAQKEIERLTGERQRHNEEMCNLRKDIVAQKKEIERLRQDRDEARVIEADALKRIDGWKRRAEAAERERDELRRALEPFCFGDQDLVDILWGDFPDDKTVTIRVPLGYLRRARAALNQEGQG